MKRTRLWNARLLGGMVAVLYCLQGGSMESTDFAAGAWKDAWLRHPVLGDASFDTFSHAAENPVVRGAPPYEWPVNGFLFQDPVSNNWYLYVGHYCAGYAIRPEAPSYCHVYRSADRGQRWEPIGPIFTKEPHVFEGEVSPLSHWPDISIVHAEGRYHLCYDWSTENTTWENAANPPAEANSGAGYAWADRPEGPFHRALKPIATTRHQSLILGKYRRIYASSIIRRENDWLVLTLTDSGPFFGWALLGMTAEKPEGPYSEPKLLLHPEVDRYHPPLLEFFPAFTHEGYIYAPATSVAANRNYQGIFRVLKEQAMDPAAWELWQAGSAWHAETVEHEYAGIWGQTFSGFVTEGVFNVMFPSRDSHGNGTINLASRPWDTPYRDQGFVISGHEGPSLGLLKKGGPVEKLNVELALQGTVTLLWNYMAPLGPDRPSSGASLHPLTQTRFSGLELTGSGWKLLETGTTDTPKTIAQGNREGREPMTVELAWKSPVSAELVMDGKAVWSGALPQGPGGLGLLAAAHSHARVNRFEATGALPPLRVFWLYTEALLDAAQNRANWDEHKDDSAFRFGVGAVSKKPGLQVKWNIEGNGFVVWAPRGPKYGTAEVFVDGVQKGMLDYSSQTSLDSAPIFTLGNLSGVRHAVRIQSTGGCLPVDCLEVMSE